MKYFLSAITLAIIIGGFLFYQNLQSRIVTLTPETVAKLEVETSKQDESLTPTHREALQTTEFNVNRNAYFGDLHTHTSISFDSYIFGNRNDLESAYRFANGSTDLTVKTGEALRLSRPLDFVAMTDHAEGFSLWSGCHDPNRKGEVLEICEEFENPSLQFFLGLRASGTKRPMQRDSGLCSEGVDCMELENTTWAMIRETADRYNQPGKFTTFIAYEYSPVLPQTGKVHRNVIFRNSDTPAHATSAYDAVTVLDLWRSLEADCLSPCEALTIPHNLNKMWGVAFSGLTIDGDPYGNDDWSLRGRSEPIAEMFQIKGASECGVGTGATDEECNFEQPIPACEGEQVYGCVTRNSFAREGLKKGLLLQEELGYNPLRIGFVAATDAHNVNAGDAEEWDFRGASGLFSSPARRRLDTPKEDFKSGIERNPGGVAVLWAEENTRDSLFDAMKRRETYATSGVRIVLRTFAGPDLPLDLATRNDAVSTAYKTGTTMGGIVPADSERMRIYVSAARDPFSAPLQKIQLIKGWVDNGEALEKVIDIACSGKQVPDDNGRCPANEAAVDTSTCAYSEASGAAELSTVWQDPEFNPAQRAFYYTRVLENPTCRWSTWDALRLGRKPRDDVPAVIQERAWSSPIWYRSNDEPGQSED